MKVTEIRKEDWGKEEQGEEGRKDHRMGEIKNEKEAEISSRRKEKMNEEREVTKRVIED